MWFNKSVTIIKVTKCLDIIGMKYLKDFIVGKNSPIMFCVFDAWFGDKVF